MESVVEIISREREGLVYPKLFWLRLIRRISTFMMQNMFLGSFNWESGTCMELSTLNISSSGWNRWLWSVVCLVLTQQIFSYDWNHWLLHAETTLITRFLGPTWGPSGADSTQVGPILAPWTLLSGNWTRNIWSLGWHRLRWFTYANYAEDVIQCIYYGRECLLGSALLVRLTLCTS